MEINSTYRKQKKKNTIIVSEIVSDAKIPMERARNSFLGEVSAIYLQSVE